MNEVNVTENPSTAGFAAPTDTAAIADSIEAAQSKMLQYVQEGDSEDTPVVLQ